MCQELQQKKIKTQFTFQEQKEQKRTAEFEHQPLNPLHMRQDLENVELSEKLMKEVRAAMRGEVPPVDENHIMKAKKQTVPPVEAPPEKSYKEKKELKKQRNKNLKRGRKLTEYADSLTADLVERQKFVNEDIHSFKDHGYTRDDISEELEDVLQSMHQVRITADMFTDDNYLGNYAFLREVIEKADYIARIANSGDMMGRLKAKDYNLYATALYWQETAPLVKKMLEFTNLSHGIDMKGEVITFPKEVSEKKGRNQKNIKEETANGNDLLKEDVKKVVVVKNPRMITQARSRMEALREQFQRKMEEQEQKQWKVLSDSFDLEVQQELNKQKISMIISSTEEERKWMEQASLIYGNPDAYDSIGKIKKIIEKNAGLYFPNKALVDKMYSDIINRFEILGEVKARINAWEEVKYRYIKYENNPKNGYGDRLCRYAALQNEQLMKSSIAVGDNLSSIRNALISLLEGRHPNMLELAVLETYGYRAADPKIMSDAPERAAALFQDAEKEIVFEKELDAEVAVLEELEEAAAYNRMEAKLKRLNFNRAMHNTLNGEGKQMTGEEKLRFGISQKKDREYRLINRDEMIGRIMDKYKDKSQYGDVLSGGKTSCLGNIDGTVFVNGLYIQRLMNNLAGAAGEGWTRWQLEDMCDNLLAGTLCRTLDEKEILGTLTEEEKRVHRTYDDRKVEELDSLFDQGMMQLKEIYLAQLRRIKDKYGLYGSQLHPKDFADRIGLEFFDDFSIDQDLEQMLESGKKYFDFENSEKDREFRDLAHYYHSVYEIVFAYFNAPPDQLEWARTEYLPKLKDNQIARELEKNIAALGGEGLSEQEETAYRRKLIREGHKEKTLFGRFKSGFDDELAMEVEVLEELEEKAAHNKMESKLRELTFNQRPERTENMTIKQKLLSGRRLMPIKLTSCKGREDLINEFDKEFSNEKLYGRYYTSGQSSFANASGTSALHSGLVAGRLVVELQGNLGGEKSTEELKNIMKKLLSCGRYRQLKEKKLLTKEEQEEFEAFTPLHLKELDDIFDQGVMELKQLLLDNLRHMRNKYGRYPSQLHPEDFLERAGLEYFDEISSLQDVGQVLTGKYYNKENEEDRELNTLADYYRDTTGLIMAYMMQTDTDYTKPEFIPNMDNFNDILPYQYIPLKEAAVGGPGFTDKEQEAYERQLKERKPDRLIARFGASD